MKWKNQDDIHASLPLCREKRRKITLFSIACCYDVWDLMKDARSRNAVKVTEEYIEGLISKEELTEARIAAQAARNSAYVASEATNAAYSALATTYAAASATHAAYAYAAANAAIYAAEAAVYDIFPYGNPTDKRQEKLDLYYSYFEDIFLQPDIEYDQPITFDIKIKDVANSIYQNKAFNNMNVLRDLLIDGEYSQELIEHCKNRCHVRGCWVIDLILGKK
jgi:hypothetical protein